jgi:hypothetical protein
VLYLEYNAELIRRVLWAVDASPEDIEDACAFAWVQFAGASAADSCSRSGE